MNAKARAKRDQILDLPCPECGTDVRLAPEDLAEGFTTECRHCGITVELRQEFDPPRAQRRWYLVDPLAEDANEERRT